MLFTLGNSSDAFLLFRIQETLLNCKTLYSIIYSLPIFGTTLRNFGDLEKLIENIRNAIPEKKKISYGRCNIIKKIGIEIYPQLKKAGIDVFDFSLAIFNNKNFDPFVRSFAIQLISIIGLETKNLDKVLQIFEDAAADKSWQVRECTAGFIRKLSKEFPELMFHWYLKMVKSVDAKQRRFVSESLRPVADNQWIHKQPEFALSIIEHLFCEKESYPRISVGNNLSDWMRIDEERTMKIIERLVRNGNSNSYWIACRACRNVVKTKPIQVMSLLGSEKYTYKNNVYYKKDYQ